MWFYTAHSRVDQHLKNIDFWTIFTRYYNNRVDNNVTMSNYGSHMGENIKLLFLTLYRVVSIS